jgi:hypothetical protein
MEIFNSLIWANITGCYANIKVKVGKFSICDNLKEVALDDSIGLDGLEKEWITYIQMHSLGLRRLV